MDFKKLALSPRTPEGYRLATSEEFNINFGSLKSRRVISGSEMVRVLDAVYDGVSELKIPFSDPSMFSTGFMLVYGQDPPAVSRSSRLVRIDLYSGISLDDQRGRNALYWSSQFRDIEAICWLKTFASSHSLVQDFRDYFLSFENLLYDARFGRIVRVVLFENSCVEQDIVCSLDYALDFERSADYAVAVVEKVCDTCNEQRKISFLQSEIERIAYKSASTIIKERQAKHIGILAKLLYTLVSVSAPETRDDSSRPNASEETMRFPRGSCVHTVSLNIITDRFRELLREACLRAYESLVYELLWVMDSFEGTKLVEVRDNEMKTLLHFADEWKSEKYTDENCGSSENKTEKACRSLLKAYENSIGAGYVKMVDERGASVLHCASFCGRGELCKLLVDEYGLAVDNPDFQGENILHYAAKGEYGYFTLRLFNLGYLLCKQNKKGQTPLHLACLYNNHKFLNISLGYAGPGKLKPALKVKDYSGRTPLHLAARGGNVNGVQSCLSEGSDPLVERDNSGKTALHHAVMNTTNNKDITLELVKLLLEHFKSEKEKALFLWTSASDIGTADEVEGINLEVQKLLQEEKSRPCEIDLLTEAARTGDSRLTWELLNRGAGIAQLRNEPEFQWVMKEVEKFSEQGRNQPTLEDTLGRDVLVECIAGHFLNPYIKSPITVSICGGSGMGKTSIMKQIEAHLLTTAAQLVFPYLWQYENFEGATNKTLSKQGKRMCRKIEEGITELLEKRKDVEYVNAMKFRPAHGGKLQREIDKRPLIYFLEKYLPEYREVYKSLACMDVNQLLQSDEEEWVYKSQGQSLGAVPRVLTVYFAAGYYRRTQEAWAGLAIEITKEIEASMTQAQRLSTRWRNAWRRNSQEICFKYILPGLLAAVVAPWVAWIVWSLLDRTSVKELQKLKYVSIPATVIGLMWYIVTYIFPVFSSVSTQIRGYLSDFDHSKQAGYQQTVISDIKFLKAEIGKAPCWIFHLWENFKNCLRLHEIVGETLVPKYASAPEGKLRVIAFVDDIEHCEDDGVLQVFWAINMVLRACEINVILAMDKDSIEKALKTAFDNQDQNFVDSLQSKITGSALNLPDRADKDFIDSFITKTVQLPLNLPDPAEDEWEDFLQSELEHEPNLAESGISTKQQVGNPYPFVVVPILRPNSQENVQQQPRDGGETNPAVQQNELQRNPESSVDDGQRGLEPANPDIEAGNEEHIQRNPEPPPDDRQQERYERDFLLASKPLLKRVRQIRDTFLLSYSKEEVETFHKLRKFASGVQKRPREWKCYLNYHKFAKNVIFRKAKKTEVFDFPAEWQVEFVVWTFVCSQWKRLMNLLIKDWYKFYDVKDNNGQKKLKPSLKEIVNNGLKNLQVEEEREEREKLVEVLDSVHDVSMDGIQLFQQFRFHCDARFLAAPR